MNEMQLARKWAFKSELEALLEKHKVELYVTDDKKPYGLHSPVLEVAFEAIYEEGEIVCDDFEYNY